MNMLAAVIFILSGCMQYSVHAAEIQNNVRRAPVIPQIPAEFLKNSFSIQDIDRVIQLCDTEHGYKFKKDNMKVQTGDGYIVIDLYGTHHTVSVYQMTYEQGKWQENQVKSYKAGGSNYHFTPQPDTYYTLKVSTGKMKSKKGKLVSAGHKRRLHRK